MFVVPYKMRILPYLCPCCGVLAMHFLNLTTFECSHRRDAITYTHDILHNKCKRPRHATQKNSNLCIKNKYHLLTLQKKIPITFEQGCTYAGVRKDNKYQYIRTIGINYRKFAVVSLSFIIYIYGEKNIPHLFTTWIFNIAWLLGTSSIQSNTIARTLIIILLRRNTRLIPFDITNIEWLV